MDGFPWGVLCGRSPACVVAIGLWAVACVPAAYQHRRCSIIAKVPFFFLSGLSVEFKIVRSKSAVFISSKCFLFFNWHPLSSLIRRQLLLNKRFELMSWFSSAYG